MSSLKLAGILEGHNGWVTSIATTPEAPNTIISGSRDKSVIVWDLNPATNPGEGRFGAAKRRLTGHSHFVQDVVISSDAQFALSGSWDNTLRLWEINKGITTKRFVGHDKEVLSVAFSADNRQIVSASRDKTIKLWNTLGECKYTFGDRTGENAHNDWVSCVRFSPNTNAPLIVSAGWDSLIKVWNLNNCKLKSNLVGHNGKINTVTVSPDGSLCASGGKDGIAMLWDVHEGKHLYSLPAGDQISALAFSPTKYWLCAATPTCIKVWNLESKSTVDELGKITANTSDLDKEAFFLDPTKAKTNFPECISLAWSTDGNTLFAGYTDGKIRVWTI